MKVSIMFKAFCLCLKCRKQDRILLAVTYAVSFVLFSFSSMAFIHSASPLVFPPTMFQESFSLSLSLCPYICHHWCRVTDAFAAADKWWDCRGGEGSSRHAPKEGRDGKELWCLYCLAWLVYESADLSLATTLIYQGNSRKGKVMSTSSPEWPGLDFPLCAGEWWWFCDFFWALCFRKKHDEFCFSVF